jgi:MFS transporter, ACS family, hexuronate transporter
MRIAPRWIAVAVFILSSALNYLDRQLLAALEPQLRAEFQLTYEDYGKIISAFSIVYALAAPVMGLLIDRVGLNGGVSLAVGLWSLATIGTGFAGSLAALIGSRGLLGFAQAGGIPSSGKAMSTYLEPRERALGTASSQIGISIGSILAPLLAAQIGAAYGWRAAFLAAGALGLVWIPLWLFTASRVPAQPADSARRVEGVGELLRKKTYWGLIAATMLTMTTSFLVKTFSLPQDVANRSFAWIPPLIGTAGGLLGGAASLKLARAGRSVPDSRRLACAAGACMLLSTALVPFAASPLLATILIAASFFGSTFLSVNLYALPLDLFARERAGFAIASLTFAYGAMQTLMSPLIGRIFDGYGFAPVCLAASLLPLAAVALLYATKES